MSDKIYPELKKHFNEVYSLEPNDLYIPGFTKFFKFISGYLKHFPFRIFIPLSFITTIMLFIIFGTLIIRLVSILQYGF